MISDKEYKVKKVLHPHGIQTKVPGSKSITNRALLIAALAEGTSTLHGVLFSDDSRHFLKALQDLGFRVDMDEKNCNVTIEGLGGRIPRAEASVQVGSAGTAARFLTAYLGLAEGTYYMDSSEQMKKRPMKELLVALEELGAEFSFPDTEYHFPYTVRGRKGKRGRKTVNEVTIDIDKSSQFLSALLIVSVLFEQDFTIHVAGDHGMAYVEMTVRMMEQFGLTIEKSQDGRTYRIPADASYRAGEYQIEPDLSAACYFYAAGAILRVPVKVEQVHSGCLQGDIQFLSVLTDMGCTMQEEPDGIRLIPANVSANMEVNQKENTVNDLMGGKWDLSTFSDQALTLSAIAPFAASPVTIENIGHIRLQECDRIHAILMNLNRMGAVCREEGDSITIEPVSKEQLHGARIETFEDHRVAMAFTIPGLILGDQRIENPSCCRKTFEDFFEVLEESVY